MTKSITPTVNKAKDLGAIFFHIAFFASLAVGAGVISGVLYSAEVGRVEIMKTRQAEVAFLNSMQQIQHLSQLPQVRTLLTNSEQDGLSALRGHGGFDTARLSYSIKTLSPGVTLSHPRNDTSPLSSPALLVLLDELLAHHLPRWEKYTEDEQARENARVMTAITQ
jgi:hypothetical protein